MAPLADIFGAFGLTVFDGNGEYKLADSTCPGNTDNIHSSGGSNTARPSFHDQDDKFAESLKLSTEIYRRIHVKWMNFNCY